MMTMMTQDTKPVTIVMVEDDDGEAKTLERAFKKAKIANPLRRAVDGIDALKMLRGEDGQPPVPRPYMLLVDINMPRMNGIDFVKTLRSDDALASSVAFILTTSKREEDKLAAYDLNVAGYIVKDTAGSDFLNLIELMDCYWRIVELPS